MCAWIEQFVMFFMSLGVAAGSNYRICWDTLARGIRI